jgi:hypothetical protein
LLFPQLKINPLLLHLDIDEVRVLLLFDVEAFGLEHLE